MLCSDQEDTKWAQVLCGCEMKDLKEREEGKKESPLGHRKRACRRVGIEDGHIIFEIQKCAIAW